MKISEFYTYAPKSKIKAGDANPEGCYQFFASSPDKHRRCDEAIYDSPAIIMGTGGGATIHYYEGKFSTSTDCLVLIPKNKINPKYLYYIFLGNMEYLKSGFHGAGLQHTSKSHVDNLEIDRIPSQESQIKIVEQFDKLEKVILNQQEQLKRLDDLIKARFVELFGNPITNEKGWDVAELNSVCDGIGDGLHGTPEYDENGGYPFINGNNLMNGIIEITPATRMVNETTYKKHYIELSDNAILLSINGTLGKLAFYNGETVMLGKSACYCNLKPNINREFVYGVMKTDAFMGFLESNATASTIKNVGLKAIRGFELILPPDELQIQFVKFSKQVNKSKFAIRRSLKILADYDII